MVVKAEQANFYQQLKPGQFLETLFEVMPGAALFVKDRAGRFMSASPAFVKMMGVRNFDEILLKTDYDFSADFLADAFTADDRRVMETGRPLLNKGELVPQGESLNWLITSKIPLYGRKGEVVGLAGVIRSVGETDSVYRGHPEVRVIVEYIREHFREKIGVQDFARVGGISVSSVERRFRKAFGLSPAKYLKQTRVNAACRLLRTTEQTMSTISRLCGFNDPTAMSRDFRKQLQMSPREYRNRYRDPQKSVA